MIRSLFYKILRGALATGAGALTVSLAATPFGWIIIPIVGAIGKAVRVRLEKKGKGHLVKWVVI